MRLRKAMLGQGQQRNEQNKIRTKLASFLNVMTCLDERRKGQIKGFIYHAEISSLLNNSKQNIRSSAEHGTIFFIVTGQVKF